MQAAVVTVDAPELPYTLDELVKTGLWDCKRVRV
jgi:hypothetical protein